MNVQVVRPAGAGHETLCVLLVCLLIIALASSVIALHGEREAVTALEPHQIDARRDLTPAEQGVYADLRIAFDEIQARLVEEQTLMPPEALAEEGFPPFVDDASAINRGQHLWRLLGDTAYFGASQSREVAGSFLMRLEDETADIWLSRADAPPPADTGEQALIDAGWLQIATQFDAGVTRQHRH